MKQTATKGPPVKKKAASIALSKSEAKDVFQRMTSILKHVLSVPKSELDKREAEYKKHRAKLKRERG